MVAAVGGGIAAAREIDIVITYEDTVAMLLDHVPELADRIKEEREWWGHEPAPPTIVFEDILNPYIRQALGTDRESSLQPVFALVERLSSEGDDRTKDLIAVAVCEPLATDPLLLRRARRLMGPATKRICDHVARHWR
jgi:hypothetical protein